MLRAVLIAACKAARLWELASTTMMFAPGAIACDHSTSSDSSSDHAGFVFAPPRFTTPSDGSGRSYARSNACKSAASVGS